MAAVMLYGQGYTSDKKQSVANPLLASVPSLAGSFLRFRVLPAPLPRGSWARAKRLKYFYGVCLPMTKLFARSVLMPCLPRSEHKDTLSPTSRQDLAHSPVFEGCAPPPILCSPTHHQQTKCSFRPPW